MENNNNVNGVLGALGYGALPQSIVGPLTTTQNTVQRTQYNPAKLKSLIDALKAEHSKMSAGEALANALSNTPQAQSFKGGFGEEIVNPWTVGLTSMARSYGDAYGARAAAAREKEEKEREDAIKAAQVDLDASKQNITNQTNTQYLKVNQNANGGTPEQQQLQKQAALDALHELDDLARNGDITSMNKSTDNWWLAGSSSKNIGRREQALSALIPMTNAIAKASGGSGINTLGEMMAYLGIPENATSAQIEGALPGMIKKLGLESDYYQMSPINGGLAF